MSALEINNLLSLAILALVSWTLWKVQSLDSNASAAREKVKAVEEYGRETRTRLIEAEKDIDNIKINVAGLRR